jgi:hypothetical protein
MLALVLVAGLGLIPAAALAQQTASIPAKSASTRTGPATMSKAELAARFQDVKGRYATVKTAAEKYLPLDPSDAADLRIKRLRLGSAMRTAEIYQDYAQKQRDELNALTELNEAQSMRMQISLDRWSVMMSMISNLMKKMSPSDAAAGQDTN